MKLAIDDASREKVQREIDELIRQKENIELRLKPVITEGDLNALEDDLSEHNLEIVAKVHKESITPKGDKVDQATSGAENLKQELDFNKSLLKSYQQQYLAIQEKVKVGGILNDSESKFVSIYDEVRRKVDELSNSYKVASKNAEQLQVNSNFDKKLYSGIKNSISGLGKLSSSVKSVNDTWGNLIDNWDDMDVLQKVTSAIGAVTSTIEQALNAYETINEVIKLFGEISEASAAKKVASDATTIASDNAVATTETTNTATKVSNDALEASSEVGKLGVKQASAIASATASGASLPFPANIAAIAAGIAAVVSAFAMISGFASGGIVGGSTTVGDYNLIRANKGEMILNGKQQAHLFRLLNSDGGMSGGNVTTSTIKIKGSDLYIALKNLGKTTPNGIKF